MSNLPLDKVAGKHLDVYEAYYKQLDPKNTNVIQAMTGAKFLKKSGLSDVVLSRIWDLSDQNGKGYLDKPGLFVALKLVSCAQTGLDINMRNILTETNAPKCGDIPKAPKITPNPTRPSVPPQPMRPMHHPGMSANTDWSIKLDEKSKYEQLFESLQPENGILPGNKVKQLLMDSKLPIDTLSTIWELADQDKDGGLDKYEFTIAMHLVYQALAKRAIPSILPKELQRQKEPEPPANNDFGGGFVANFPKELTPVVAPIIPTAIEPPKTSPITIQKSGWILTTMEKLRYDEVFEKSDLDKDGLVSGAEIREIFLKSGLQQNILAHIWALCDTNQSGKLNSEQFALAMWLVDRKKKGIDPPVSLTPEMIPPSMRPNAEPIPPPKPVYTNPELEMISKEIEELAKERRIIESEVAQKEADIRIKSGEVRSLQSELDTLTATLKQLENQKGEAQKRLDDLKAQVNKIREQCQKQESTLKEQETELDARRSELQKLKEEEAQLEREYDDGLKELEKLSRQLQDTQLQINQVKSMVTQLEEIQRQMNDALAMCRNAIDANDPILVSDYSLKIEPEFREFRDALEAKKEEPAADPFSEGGAKAKVEVNGFKADFNEPFKPGGFDDSFDNQNTFGSSGFSAEFPKPSDPFAETNADPFGDKMASSTASKEAGKDDFGSDPFAILHAPTTATANLAPSPVRPGPPQRPESPSPALPPKNKKPPPRPAPPKMGPKPTGDSFGSFANFDDFDNKNLVSNFGPPAIQNSSVSVKSNANVSVASKTSAPEPPAFDFVEDPFKDYRYEDTFNIADPFDDSGDMFAEKSSDIKNNNIVDPFTNTANNIVDPFMPPDKPLKTEFTHEFDFSKMDSEFSKFSQPSKKTNDDPFKVIDSNNTRVTSNDANNNFGAFKDDFEDEFSKFNINNLTDMVKKETKNSFEVNFAQFDAFNNNSLNNSNVNTSTASRKAPHKFDNFTNNLNSNQKNSTNKTSTEEISKFREDYSKNFDEDLEAVLRRSMVDK